MKKNNKGFTLVELIVVLVILAILAAMLIPALTGYIDRAQEDKIKTTTRQVVVAAQTVVSEAYGKNNNLAFGLLSVINSEAGASFDPPSSDGVNIGEICELAEIGSNLTKQEKTYTGTSNNGQQIEWVGYEYTGSLKDDITWIGIEYSEKGKVTMVKLSMNGKLCTYNGETGEYTVE